MRRAVASLLGLIGLAAFLAGINMVAETRLADVQLDLTAGHIYTLSPGTRRILAGLHQPITLRLFYSRDLGTRAPSYDGYHQRVSEMLDQYARLAHGMVKVERYDPEPFSDAEDKALSFGLQAVPIDQSGAQVFFGLVGTNLLDDERAIPFFQEQRERFLEYDLTRLVYELSNPTRPVVGVMSSLPIDGDPRLMMMAQGRGRAGQPWIAMSLLRQSYAIRTVPLTVWRIDPEIQVLLVAQAQHLPESTQYAIDQFVMRGGRLMLMVDPQSAAQADLPGPGGMPQTDTASDLHRLLEAWGIAYDPNQVVGDLTGAWRVRASPGDRMTVTDYVPWFNIRDGINHDDPATADLTQITVADPGFLAKKPGADITLTPLLSSSPRSGLIAAEKLRMDPDPAAILAGFKPEGGARVIVARLHGALKSAFSGPPAPPAGEQRPGDLPPFKDHTEGAANLVIAADVDILADRFWVRGQDFFGQQDAEPFSDNGPFVANVIGTLAGGDALIGLRARGAGDHPFTLVDDMQRRAEAQFRRTQQDLQKHLDETEKKLANLREGSSQPGAAQAVLTPEQHAAIDAANQEIVQTRQKLRGVERALREDIDALAETLRFFDIVLVPAILTLIAIGLGLMRHRRRGRARS